MMIVTSRIIGRKSSLLHCCFVMNAIPMLIKWNHVLSVTIKQRRSLDSIRMGEAGRSGDG